MTKSNLLSGSIDPPGVSGEIQLASEAPTVSPVDLIDDRLRGRWRMAIAIGCIVGLVGAVAAFLVAPVRFVSTGSIHVMPAGQPILFETSDTVAMPRYDGVVQTQALLVAAPRVVSAALRDPDVSALALAERTDGVEEIMGRLRAEAVRGTELVSVSYESEDAREAQTVLNAILEAYESIHGGRHDAFRSRRVELLREQRAELRSQRNLKRQSIQDFVAQSEYGSESLQDVLEAKLLRIEELKAEREQLELALSTMETPTEDGADPAATPTDDELARIDPDLQRLRDERDDLEDLIARLRQRYAGTHMIVQRAERDLGDLEHRLQARRDRAIDAWQSGASGVATNGHPTAMTQADIATRQTLLRSLIDRNKQEIRGLHEEQSKLSDLNHDLEEIEDDLREVDDTLRVLQIESDALVSGHVSIAEFGSLPTRPAKDRRLPLAVVAFGGGIGGTMAFFFLLGTLDRRAFSARQLEHATARYRCLGVLPHLDSGRVDKEMTDTASQCVHQIRNRLESMRSGSHSFVLVVTSPYQGDGKTSLSMALGWSYAAAGFRTLLVDADWYGQSLSAQLGVAGDPGLKEAIKERAVGDHVMKLSVPNLSVLGAGHDPHFGPEAIRRDDFGVLVEDLRQEYDVILIDTGPAIGSVELFPVASAADGVVFSVRRGRSRTSLDGLCADLESMRVPVFGVILNCADQADCERYVSKSTVSARRGPDDEDGATPPDHRNHLVRALEDASGRR